MTETTGRARPGHPTVLVLWDIDHTLIDTLGVSYALYERAFLDATGRVMKQVTFVSGRTDLDVMLQTLRDSGVEPDRESVDALASCLVEQYRGAVDELAATGRVLPGVPETLVRLAAEPAVHQGVLTGNLREVARLKLAAFGLDAHLDLDASAYGDEHTERADLVPVARRRAATRTGHAFRGTDTVLIGETPNDVAAAAKAGVRVIAVATGRSSADELGRVS